MTPEGKVKKECRAYLKSIGAYIYSPVSMGYGEATVDDLVCLDGFFIAIEFKRGDKPAQPTERQERCLQRVCHAGGQGWVIRSLPELKACLGTMARYSTPLSAIARLKEKLRD